MKIITALISFFICFNLIAQKGNLVTSNWRENSDEEFIVPSDRYSYFKKGDFYLYISNDDANIYLDMMFKTPAIHNRILKEGLIVWLNMDGKLSKNMGIRFPIGTQGTNELHKPTVNVNPDGTIATPISHANKMELIGFKSENSKILAADNAESFRGSVKYDNSGVLHYKMLLPVAKLPLRNSKENNGAMPFALGIEYGTQSSINNPKGNMSPPPPLTPPSGGVRSRSRGGSGGGAASGRSQGDTNSGSAGSQNNPPSVLLWIKNIKLATAR
jgi:hypothetical protein